MRANGVDEDLITGDASPREKFQAWAETVPYTLRNPIHHWTHIELQRYFGIDLMLGPDTAEEIWERANAKLAEPDFCVHGILRKFDVRVVGTTDDPADPLDDHAAIATSELVHPRRPHLPPGQGAAGGPAGPADPVAGETRSHRRYRHRPRSRTCSPPCRSATTTSTPPAAACPTMASTACPPCHARTRRRR